MEIAALGLRVEGVTDVDRASSSLDKLAQSGDRAGRSQGGLAVESTKSSRSIEQVSAASDRATRGISGLSSAARIAVGALAALGVSVGISQSIRQIADFQSAINGLAAVSGATASEMRSLEQQARTLGATSMFSAQQAAEGQRFLAQAGFEVNEILSATPGILRLATAGGLDLASAADIASNVLGGMRLEVDQLNRVNDVLAATAARSNTSIQQLGQALSFAAPFAAGAGVAIEEAAAAIGVMSDAGIQASRAGTGLVGVIRQLSNVTTAGESVLNKYGLSIQDVNIEALGLETVLENLRAANLNTADSIALFGSEAGAAAQVLINDYSGAIEGATGEAERMANQLEQGLGPAFAALSSAVSESVLQLGDSGLAAALESLVNTATGVISVWNGMGDTWAEANEVGERTLTLVEGLATAITVLSAAAGARAVQAIGGLIAAKVGLTGATLTLTGALTGLRTVVMTLLGPVGIIAGGLTLLYQFREELGLTGGEAYQTSIDVDGLTDAFRGLTEAQQENKRASLVSDLIEMRIEAGRLGAEVRQVSELVRNSGQLTPEGGALPIATAEDIQRGRELRQELEKTLVNIDGGTTLLGEYDKAMEGLGQTTSDTTTRTRDLSETTSAAAKAIADQEKQTESLTSDLRALRDRLQPARAAQIQMAQSMNTLTLAYASGRLQLSDYLDLVRLLQIEHIEAANEAEEAADRIGYSFTTWEEVALNTVRRVDDAGQNLWLGFIDGSRNALDTVKRFFQQTLAEIAHMLTTQRLTVAVAGSLGLGGSGAAMAGGGGIGGVGGLSGLWSGARSLIGGNQFGSGIADIGRAISPTGDMGSWFSGAGQYANWQYGLAGLGGGLVGNMFGGHGGIGGSLGSTIGMAAGGPIGAAVGTVLGGALGSLFGGSRSSPELNLRTVATGTMPSGGTGWEHHGSAYTSGVFGDIGFADRGTSRLSRQFPDGEHEFLEAIAGMDAMMASLAQSEEQFRAMESAARSWSARAGGPQGIADQLSDRTATILGALDGEFGKFVRNLDGGLEEVVTQALTAREALTLLSAAQGRLGFVFNQSASGAYDAAFAIAELAGGLDNLAAMQEAYYQAYFTEAERAAHLQEDLTKALAELGLQLPASRDGFRQLVEAQDLNTKAGREAYVTLLSLAGGFDQLQQALSNTEHTTDRLRDAWATFQRDSLRMQQELLALAGDSAGVLALAREQELAAMDESLRPFQERLWALQDEAEALNNYHRELERVGTQLGSALNQIQGFVDQRRGTLGTPAQNLEEIERQWREQLSLAQSGDMSALRSITQYADRLMQAGQDYFASGEGFQDIQEQVLSALEGLDSLTAEEFLADEIRDAIEGLDIDQIARTALDELAALQSLHDTTQSQVSLLVDINQSVMSVRDILEGMGAVPSFANGGYHSGGLRLVGERGPELEVTGPSRIFDASTTRSMLSPAPLLGGSDVTELLQDLKRELAATREENRKLLERVGDNTGATAGAVMQGNETSARQRSEQIREQRAANRAARITKGGRVT